MTYKEKPIVIAEIGCNHKGDFDIAKQMIFMAKTFCDADVVKFQKRTNEELLALEEYNAPHPNRTIVTARRTVSTEILEFTAMQHAELKKYCEEIGVHYSTSVWDLTAAKEIVALKPKTIKIRRPAICVLIFSNTCARNSKAKSTSRSA